MSIQQRLEKLDVDPEELADNIARSTVPGPSNEGFFSGLDNASDVVPKVIDHLNNWFYLVDVRVYGRNHIGMPMRYRWSIIRWANQDMDEWLQNMGWTDMPHRNADSHTREVNELEARYRREFDGVTVDCNFLVEFPDVVFEKLNGRGIDNIKSSVEKKRKKSNTIEEVIEARRGG